ncbi:MAG: helix-turn-helix domain-containing protein [Microcoleaceae cyanobacterium]
MELQSLGGLGAQSGNASIEISQKNTRNNSDILKSLITQIEAELLKSDVYSRVLASLRTMLGDAAVGAEILMKALGREAILLAVKGIARKKKKASTLPNASAPNPVSVGVENPITPRPPVVDVPAQQEKITTSTRSRPVSMPYQPLNAEDTIALTSSPVIPEDSEPLAEVRSQLPTRKKSKRLTKAEKAALALKEREESLQKVGEKLREARQVRSLSLHQLHSQTMIPLHHLDALEKGKFERLPEYIYVRGFIRRVAEALGLNAEELLASLPSPEIAHKIPSWCMPELEKSSSFVRPVHLYLGYTALMAGAVSGVSWLSHQNPPDVKGLPDIKIPSSANSPAKKHSQPAVNKPGLKSSISAEIIVSNDMAPPVFLG